MSFAVLLGCCSARIYKVGDSKGWTAKDDVYYSQAETDHQAFHVGDSLAFDPIINDVTQVSGSLEYEMRLFFSKSVYNTGHDVLTLTESGFHYFITSNQAQCVTGQKLKVLVIHDPSRPIPPPPPSKTLPVGQTYKVGDSKGWKVYDSDFYKKWSEEKQFQIGDTLLFKYATEINDVYEISGALVVRKTGHDLVRLTEPGVHYFITSHSGHLPVTNSNFPKKVDLSGVGIKKPNRTESNRTNRTETDSNRTKVYFKPFG